MTVSEGNVQSEMCVLVYTLVRDDQYLMEWVKKKIKKKTKSKIKCIKEVNIKEEIRREVDKNKFDTFSSAKTVSCHTG